MAIFQGLLALITRSLGSILSALFGWAVVALFGPTGPREKVWLSALVGAAAAWPLLLGVIWPRAAAVPSSGLPRVSAKTSICRPSMPPLALISSAASWAACFMSAPSA